MKRSITAAVLVVPLALGAAACSGSSRGQVKGTFPYCSYQPVSDGVFVPEENHGPCVVDDAREANDRAGYKGGHVIVVPQGTTKTRSPLPVPSTTKAAPTKTPSVTLTKKK